GLQVYEVQAPVPDGPLDAAGAREVASAFEDVYARRYGEGAGYRQAGIILTAIGLRVHGRVRKPAASTVPLDPSTPSEEARAGERPVYWTELRSRIATPVWHGERLAPGNVLGGPAVVELPDTTVVVRPETTLQIDALGNAVLTTTGADSAAASRGER
ncbi:MAG: hydantoinase/oxoprolinase family protein, partial [Gaiellales bacterium]